MSSIYTWKLSTLVLLIAANLCNIRCERNGRDKGPAPFFAIEPDNIFSKGRLFYRKLVLDSASKSVYVGAMNSLYRLWMKNINETTKGSLYSEVSLPPTAEAYEKCTYRKRNQEYLCQNHIRVLIKKPDGLLYVCSTNAFSPIGITLENPQLRAENGGISGAAICPVDPDDNGTATWVESGNPSNIPSIYSATVTDFTQTNRIVYRPPLMNERTGEVVQTFIRTVHTDSKWLNEPQFVGSFDLNDKYVYFFFREIAVEHINCGKAVYSRVARVCKNDVGGENVLKQNFATFLKVRLNCSIAGEFPFYFDEIQDVYKETDENGEVGFFATFATSLNGFFGSAVCGFSLRDINEAFDRGSFKEQLTSAAAWLPVLSNLVPDPRPGQCVDDTRAISDTSLHFIKSHPLMDGCVLAAGDGQPILYKSGVVFTKLVVDVIDVNEKRVLLLFVAAVTGELYKILRWINTDGQQRSKLLAIYKLPSKEPVRALTLLQNEYLYVAQDAQVSQLEVGQCYRYKFCSQCVSDPYCSWSTVKQQCDRWQDSFDRTTGWIRMSPDSPDEPACIEQTRQLNKVANVGDSVHLDCYRKASNENHKVEAAWFRNNERIESNVGRMLFTVDGGLVIVNVSSDDLGIYHCIEQRHTTVRYQLTVRTVNCQTPQNASSYYSMYKEWCKEFQEYKRKIDDWQKRQQNMKCSRNIDEPKKTVKESIRVKDDKSEIKKKRTTKRFE